ncbi:MAG: ribose 1,5-bisphosphate isomerase [Euryarchaeota archaeon]|nr:ribose 1,5-bisphosphate isomerase [Euryarchaeota archaeon]
MKVNEVARSIKNMEIRGAGLIARSAAEALKHSAKEFQGEDLTALMRKLEESKDILVGSRPTAISLWNAVQATLRGSQEATDVEELRNIVVFNADRFVKRSSEAVQLIGKFGAKRLKDDMKILTHCNSKAALSVIKNAHSRGMNIEVYATESRPWRQGILTVKELSDVGIPCTLIIDSAVRWAMKDVDAVFVGADTICSNGALINKIGTSQIAMAASDSRVPFMVCAETYKFSPRTLSGEMVEIEERDASEVIDAKLLPPGVKIRNPVFDATPPEYIDSLITELGVISPYAAYEVIVREFGQASIFEEMGD